MGWGGFRALGGWRSRFPIGIDLGGRSVRMLQLSGGGSRLAVRAAAKQALGGHLTPASDQHLDEAARACGALLDSAPFCGRDVVLCLPESVVAFKSIRLPSMPADELDQAVRWEVRDRFALADQAATVQYLPAGQVHQGGAVMDEWIVMAAADQALQPYVELIERLGLNAAALDVTPIALARCARRMVGLADGDEDYVVVDIGRLSSRVVIVRQGRIAFYKRADAALSADAARLADETAAELVHEIGLCLRYFAVTFRGSPPGKAWLTGGAADADDLARVLSQRLSLQVRAAEPLAGVALGGGSNRSGDWKFGGDWAVAMGAALRGAGGSIAPWRGAA